MLPDLHIGEHGKIRELEKEKCERVHSFKRVQRFKRGIMNAGYCMPKEAEMQHNNHPKELELYDKA